MTLDSAFYKAMGITSMLSGYALACELFMRGTRRDKAQQPVEDEPEKMSQEPAETSQDDISPSDNEWARRYRYKPEPVRVYAPLVPTETSTETMGNRVQRKSRTIKKAKR